MRLTRQDIKGMALDFLEILRHREINDLIESVRSDKKLHKLHKEAYA